MGPFPSIENQAIAASAGSGKTYQLTNRYIGLIHAGAPPSAIVALTFSRKAAGEILDKIILRLAAAASDAANAEELYRALDESGCLFTGCPLDASRSRTLLRQLIFALPICRIGTFDSFFVSILRAFPFEFGLSGAFDIIDGFNASTAKREVLKYVFADTGDGDAPSAFLEMFKQATFGAEEKNLGRALDTFIDRFHGLLMEARPRDLWGDSRRIWPERCRWLDAVSDHKWVDDIAQAGFCGLRELEGHGFPEKLEEGLRQLLQEATGLKPGSRLSAAAHYVFTHRILPVADQLLGGAASFVYNRKTHELSKDFTAALRLLLIHVMGCELAARIETTQGVYRILDCYEKQYERRVRRRGKLSFADVQYLLTRSASDAPGQWPELSCCQSDEARIYIDYRLDGTFRHWLIDEFQDTSTLQWFVVRNLLDEVLQSPDGERSLFYVGDVKQAIYGWRGGDSELFHAILRQYNTSVGERIRLRHLSKSWRSSRAVIDTVNQVFDHLCVSDGLAESVVARWRGSWSPHESARQELPGYAVLYQIPREKGDAPADQQNRFELITCLIKGLRGSGPAHPSVAVLVRSNDAGVEVTEFLRSRGIEAVWEGSFSIRDNELVAALLSLLKLADHPGDLFAWQHLQMTPFRELTSRRAGGRHEVAMDVLRTIHDEGFEKLLRVWTAELSSIGQLPHKGVAAQFVRNRLRQLFALARQFDLDGVKDTVSFIDLVEQSEIRDGGMVGSVQVMTIHRAKGLEFDAVFLPELDGSRGITSGDCSGIQLHKTRDIGRAPLWALAMPPRDMALVDEVLKEFVEASDADVCYEQLCNLYVAMTRARHSLYMVTTAPGSTSSAVYHSTLLRNHLQCTEAAVSGLGVPALRLYETGDCLWHAKLAPPPALAGDSDDLRARPLLATDSGAGERRRVRFERQTPSGEERSTIEAAWLFSPRRSFLTRVGTAVHALFERYSWAGGTDAGSIVERWRGQAEFSDDIRETAIREFMQALANPQIRDMLLKPGPDAILWREKRFEILLDGAWISGVFDRVHIVPDADGQCYAGATIIDFKTDYVADDDNLARALDIYRPQLHLYQRVLSVMLTLPAERINLCLLFTRAGRAVAI